MNAQKRRSKRRAQHRYLLSVLLPCAMACNDKASKVDDSPSAEPAETRPTEVKSSNEPKQPLALEASELSALASYDRDAWERLAARIRAKQEPGGGFAKALWSESPDPARWISKLAWAMRDVDDSLSIQDSHIQASNWLRRSLEGDFEEGHEAHRRYAIAHAQTVGLSVEAVRELQSRAKAKGWPAADQGLIDILLADAAIHEATFEVALEAAERAVRTLRDAGDEPLLNRAERILVVQAMRQGQWERAFELADKALATKLRVPPNFPYGTRYSKDPYEQGLQEIDQVARWAGLLTPEWIRCLAVIAATTKDANLEKQLLARIEVSMKQLKASEYGEDDAEVVSRQLRERDFDAMAKRVEGMVSRP